MFVDGIPPNVRWQELKDHFSVIGEVKFASVSVDRGTGRSKGHGLVQYISRELAEEAIASMRDHPLEGATLFVRKDVQERGRRDQSGGDGHGRDSTMPGDWECGRCFVNNFARRHECFKCGAPKADARPSSGGRAPWDEPREWRRGAGQGASADEDEVIELLSARDVMRRAKDYESADAVREELLAKGVKLDDSSRPQPQAVAHSRARSHPRLTTTTATEHTDAPLQTVEESADLPPSRGSSRRDHLLTGPPQPT